MPSQPFFRHALVYGFGNLLFYATGFFLLPIYLRQLSIAEYGELEILKRMAEIVTISLIFNGLRQALFTFYKQSPAGNDQNRVVSTAVFLGIGFVFLGGLGAVVLANPLCAFLELSDPGLVPIAVTAALLEAFNALLLTVSQARIESRFFVLVTLTQFLARLLLCILLVVVFHWGIWGLLIASLVASAAYAFWLTIREIAHNSLVPDRQLMKEMLVFALPFVPGGLGFFILNNGDRFILLHYGGREEVGIYGLGYQLAQVVGLFSLTPLLMVWNARMYEEASSEEAPAVFGRAFTRISAAYLGAGLAVCLFSEEIVTFLGGQRYRPAASLIPPVVLAYFFLAIADQRDAGFYIRRRTILKAPITLASTLVMVGLYFAFIPSHRAMGAALATLLGFAFHAALTGVVAHYVFPIHFEAVRLAAMVGLAVLIWLTSGWLPGSVWSMFAKVGLWALWPLALWGSGIVSRQEKRLTALGFRQALAKGREILFFERTRELT